ncbi:MAG: 4Fe-4S binding protein [Planctomycetes bacterium]|nr:4Fe-4S binding protein [Planctomycetota bacterium]
MSAKVDGEKCTGCESCIPECPADAISLINGKAVIDADTCIDCGLCIEICPVDAISME